MQNIGSIGAMLLQLRDDENTYLALNPGITASGFARTRIVRTAQTPAWLIHGKTISEWRPHGFTEQEGALCLYGPNLNAITLEEVLRIPDEKQVLGYLVRVSNALLAAAEAAAEAGLELPRIATFGVLLVEDGGVLLLPKPILDGICEHLPRRQALEMVERYNHPDLTGEAAITFSLAALTYTAVTGRPPYAGDTIEELRERMRDRPPTEPLVARPDLKPELADHLLNALSPERERKLQGRQIQAPALADWPQIIEETRSAGPSAEPGAGEPDPGHNRLLRAAEKRERRYERRYRRSGYLRRNTARLVISTIVILVLGGLFGNILYQQLQPRSISGYAPDEVVRAFYESINTLDHETMSETVVDGAGRQEIQQVMRLYVGSRVRIAMEQREGFTSAQEWRDAGMPPIEPGEMLFGVAELEITSPEPASGVSEEDELRFLARYERWYTADTGEEPGETPEQGEGRRPEIEGYRHEDRLHLKRDGNDWVIYLIEERAPEPIDPTELRP